MFENLSQKYDIGKITSSNLITKQINQLSWQDGWMPAPSAVFIVFGWSLSAFTEHKVEFAEILLCLK